MSDLHETAGSYAVDALDTAELAEFEAHLATCEICRDEVAELCETAAELSLLVLADPPPGLRDDIMAEIRLTPQPPAVDEVALRRSRRRSRFLTGLVAAMLALAVGLGGVVYSLVQDRQAQVAQISLEQQLYAAPDVEFKATDLKGGGKATFVYSEQLNRALFIGSDLPDPGSDKRYQLWTMNGPEPKWVVATSITRDSQI